MKLQKAIKGLQKGTTMNQNTELEPAPAKHTPHLLKWEEQFLPEDNGASNGIWIYYTKNGQPVASFVNTSEHNKKLADLFTAAPETAAERDRLKDVNKDLLEALIGVVDCAGLGRLPGYEKEIDSAVQIARAAIAKATRQ